jgi:hypothetical protein
LNNPRTKRELRIRNARSAKGDADPLPSEFPGRAAWPLLFSCVQGHQRRPGDIAVELQKSVPFAESRPFTTGTMLFVQRPQHEDYAANQSFKTGSSICNRGGRYFQLFGRHSHGSDMISYRCLQSGSSGVEAVILPPAVNAANRLQ